MTYDKQKDDALTLTGPGAWTMEEKRRLTTAWKLVSNIADWPAGLI